MPAGLCWDIFKGQCAALWIMVVIIMQGPSALLNLVIIRKWQGFQPYIFITAWIIIEWVKN
jgi:hypothetical protein